MAANLFSRSLRARVGATLVLLLAVLLVPRASAQQRIVLPNGWVVNPPPGAMAPTGTMPQGMAPSPDGGTVAVVESGYNPPALGLYRLPELTRLGSIRLPGAFGRPIWLDAQHVLLAGANADALLEVDVTSQRVTRIALPKGSYPVHVALAADGTTVAVATDGDGAVRIGTLATVGSAPAIPVGLHPSGVAFDAGGDVLATSQGGSQLIKIAAGSHALTRQATELHPSALAVDGAKIYVAQSDADSLGVYDVRDLHVLKTIALGDATRAPEAASALPGPRGVSPNSITVNGDTAYVSLGAANSIAIVRNEALAGRSDAGWYPTDAFAAGKRLYVLDGKGEGSLPNPAYRSGTHSDVGYVGAIEAGSLRAYDVSREGDSTGNPQGAAGLSRVAASALLQPNGPIRHVFFVLKENRSYDQVLGDVSAGNGDRSLAWFGKQVTPNQHALAERFGLFDNAYTSGEVSAPGHMWSDAAFANDYVERWWPLMYGDRRETDDISNGGTTRNPAAGYIWDAAGRAHVSFRDYGEQLARGFHGAWIAAVPSLIGRFDPDYAGWDLDYSDLDRVKEWRREFRRFVASGTLPQFEFIWLPNDHTYGAKPGKLTPRSYVATNDYALGQMVQTLSHSPVWKSSAMFVIEDDAQDGPDHVSDQRTTMYLISPYARGGVVHDHYATVGVLRTIEMILGVSPLSAYDAMAVPMVAAFGKPDFRPYTAISPQVDITQRNSKVAYGAAVSNRLNFARPDAVPPDVLDDILAHNLQR